MSVPFMTIFGLYHTQEWFEMILTMRTTRRLCLQEAARAPVSLIGGALARRFIGREGRQPRIVSFPVMPSAICCVRRG